jgi:hypothetical protein
MREFSNTLFIPFLLVTFAAYLLAEAPSSRGLAAISLSGSTNNHNKEPMIAKAAATTNDASQLNFFAMNGVNEAVTAPAI